MKCLEKDRTRRYETAAALAADVRRYLADEPVLARPPDAAYRLRKFAAKHRPLVAGAAAVVATLVLGLAGTTAGFLRAADAAGRRGEGARPGTASEGTGRSRPRPGGTDRPVSERDAHLRPSRRATGQGRARTGCRQRGAPADRRRPAQRPAPGGSPRSHDAVPGLQLPLDVSGGPVTGHPRPPDRRAPAGAGRPGDGPGSDQRRDGLSEHRRRRPRAGAAPKGAGDAGPLARRRPQRDRDGDVAPRVLPEPGRSSRRHGLPGPRRQPDRAGIRARQR